MPHDPRDLAFEVRLLREAIDALSEAVAEGAKVAQRIASERKQIQALFESFNAPQPVAEVKPSLEFAVPKGQIAKVLEAVCHQWDIPVELVMSELRGRGATYPRFAFCHIAHKRLGRSSSYVAGLLNRDHTTILHACERAEQLMSSDKDFSSKYSAVMTALQAMYTPTSDQMN